MQNMKTSYQITEFADVIIKQMQKKYNDDKIRIHYNTVDKWFKTLESKRIHYILRTQTDDEKVYDELDLKIGCFIFEKRREKWRLDIIFDNVPNYMEVRPFPVEEGTSSSLTTIDEEAMFQRVSARVEKQILTFVGQQFTIMENNLRSQLQTMLPAPKDETREAQILEEIVQQQVKQLLSEQKNDKEIASLRIQMELELEEEAVREWGTLPESQRMKKRWGFLKEEDLNKKAEFIRNYKRKRIKDL